MSSLCPTLVACPAPVHKHPSSPDPVQRYPLYPDLAIRPLPVQSLPGVLFTYTFGPVSVQLYPSGPTSGHTLLQTAFQPTQTPDCGRNLLSRVVSCWTGDSDIAQFQNWTESSQNWTEHNQNWSFSAAAAAATARQRLRRSGERRPAVGRGRRRDDPRGSGSATTPAAAAA